jgi:uncharacterized repeat protein (TIGR01451 family)
MKARFFPAFMTVAVLLCAASALGQAATTTPARTSTPTLTPTSNRTADLTLSKTASPSPARVGQNLTYTLTVRNNGPSNAINVFLTDSLPAGVEFVSAGMPNATCSHGPASVWCSLVILGPAGTIQALIVVRPTAAGSLTNSASVYSNGFDPNLSDNTATVTTEVREPGIALFLHGNGDPAVLSLDGVAPAAAVAKYRDSAALVSGLRNPWVEVGAWTAPAALISGTFVGLEELHGWLGLRNSDDQGTQFDLRAEVWKNGIYLVGAGETSCVKGVVRDPALAKETTVPLDLYTPVDFDGAADVLSLKVLARIGTGCSGPNHGGATGLRFYYDGVSRPSRFALTPGLRLQ